MKQRKTVLALLLVLCIIFTLTSCGNDGNSANDSNSPASSQGGTDDFQWEEVNFRVTSHLSPSHNLYVNYYEPVYQYIEEQTGGAVTFDVFWSGELVELGGESDALLNGVVDMAWPISPTYESTKMPFGEVTLLPVTDSDCPRATVAWELMLESDVELVDGMTYYELMFGQYGLKAFAPVISETYLISTVGKDLQSPDDFQGLQIRTSARPQALYVENLGAANITLPGADLFDALNRGTIDSSVMWVADWPNYGLDGLFDYALEGVNLGHFPSVWAMTQERWDSLQPELQDLMLEAMEMYRPQGAEAVKEISEEVKTESIEKGVEFIHLEDLNEDLSSFLTENMTQVWYDYIELLEAEGQPGTEICRLWRDCLLEAGCEVPEEILDL